MLASGLSLYPSQGGRLSFRLQKHGTIHGLEGSKPLKLLLHAPTVSSIRDRHYDSPHPPATTPGTRVRSRQVVTWFHLHFPINCLLRLVSSGYLENRSIGGVRCIPSVHTFRDAVPMHITNMVFHPQSTGCSRRGSSGGSDAILFLAIEQDVLEDIGEGDDTLQAVVIVDHDQSVNPRFPDLYRISRSKRSSSVQV